MNIEKINKILHKGDKRYGLGVVITSLVLILSIALGAIANPLLLIQFVTIIPILGEWGTTLLYLMIIGWTGIYYFDMGHELFTKRRQTAFILFAISIFMFILTCVIINDVRFASVGQYYSIVTYYEHYANVWFDKLISFKEINGIDPLNIGFILPLVIWIQSLLGTFEWFGLFIWIPLSLYLLYVIVQDDWQIYFAKLNPFTKEEDNINSSKGADSIDLNEATEEFNLNFTEEEKKKIEIIEKVRNNMDNSSYDELSEKIRKEKEKLLSLKEKVQSKIREQNENVISSSKMTDDLRDKLQGTLGYTTYSLLRKKAEEAKIETEQLKNELNSSTVAEEKKESNLPLINDGYKTTEEVLSTEDPMLSDDFVNSLLESYDPTMEIPLIEEYYNDIFSNEDRTVEEIIKTLETEIDLIDEKTSEQEISEVSGEIVIEQLEEELSVEEYLSIPEDIEKSIERVMDIQQVHAIAEQKEDDTINDEFENFAESTSTAEISLETEGFELEEEEDEEEDEGRPADWCKPYVLPSTSILSTPSNSFDNSILVEEANSKSKKINEVLESFNIKANVNSFEIGPTVSTFKLELTPGVKTTKVTSLEDNFKLAIGAEYIRILAPIPGTSFIGIEVPNSTKRPVTFKNVFDETKDNGEGIQISIGQDVTGKPMSFDLTKAPHLLVAGSTGSGKSVAINTILSSILLRYKPTDVQLVLVDPKMVEFAPFHGIPHLLAEVIIDANNANKALQAMVQEMEDRYLLMAKKGAKKIEELNEILINEGEEKKPYIVVIIDELADLMMVAAKEVEESIMRITQKARAAGIHMVLATQRPSTEIITGTIKSNIPSRMAFTVASSIDSRTILGQVGAEKLIGMGDMLVSMYGKLPIRGQGAYISNGEVEDITAFTKSQCSAHYVIDVEKFSASQEIGGALIELDDPIYIAAKDTVIHYQKASTSMLQRHLNVGYNKAANIIETLEVEGIIGPARGSKPREVLVQQ